jgi:hypothetical protein
MHRLLTVSLCALTVACGDDGNHVTDGSTGTTAADTTDASATTTASTSSQTSSDSDSNATTGQPTTGVSSSATQDASTGDTGPEPEEPFDCTPTGTPGTYAVTLEHPGGPALLGTFLNSASPSLAAIVAEFHAAHPGEYDFVYLMTESTSPDVSARFMPVRHEDLPSIGLPGAYADPEYADFPDLRGVVVIGLDADQTNGPTLHETAHAWGVFLDPELGFGRDADNDFFSHWGASGVMGQLGGFDPATLHCTAPSADATTDCTEARTGAFGPTANSGDAVPYAPFELYLMGLLPASEIPSPIPLLDTAHFVSYDDVAQEMTFTLDSGIRSRTVEEVLTAMGGERPPMPLAERSMRGAFVLVTDGGALSPTALDRATAWARIFSGVDDSLYLQSFCDATGGRARIDVAL